jgi:hypothetical protein
MDEMMWRKTRRTSSQVMVAVLTQLSFVQLHTWQTAYGGREHGQRDPG